MPRAPTSSSHSKARSRALPVTVKLPLLSHGSPSNALEVSSGSESNKTPPPLKTTKRIPSLTTKKIKQKPPIESQDVIEISSDDDDNVHSTQASIIADLRGQVKKLEEESNQHHLKHSALFQELTRCRDELKEVNAKASAEKPTGKLILDPLQLEDGLNCEICTRYIFSPYLLPDCGHTFCLSCLRDWFGATHARFIQANPHWNTSVLNSNANRILGLLRPEYLAHPDIYHRLLQLQTPQPEYTCPTCRKRVLRRPVEVYALKSLVRGIVAANEAEKEAIPSEKLIVERRHGHLVPVDPWDGFFPRER